MLTLSLARFKSPMAAFKFSFCAFGLWCRVVIVETCGGGEKEPVAQYRWAAILI